MHRFPHFWADFSYKKKENKTNPGRMPPKWITVDIITVVFQAQRAVSDRFSKFLTDIQKTHLDRDNREQKKKK